MSVSAAISGLRQYPQNASQEFRDQLDIVGKIKSQQDPSGNGVYVTEGQSQGIDRTLTFRPIARPSFARTTVR